MKTKFKLNLGGFTINTNTSVERNEEGVVTEVISVPVEIPAINIEGEVEYTAGEMLELWNTYKTIMKEAPEVLGEFASKLVEEYYKAEEKVMPLHEEHQDVSC